MSSDQIHREYLPFSREQLEPCFQFTRRGSRHPVDIYVGRANRYADYRTAHPTDEGVAKSAIRRGRQLEKDETFWTAACLLDFQHAPDVPQPWVELLRRAFGKTPPLAGEGLTSWEECCAGDLHLFLEVGLPAPLAYRQWLSENDQGRSLVPYVSEAATRARARLEGHTQLDAMLLAPRTGFAVHFESKVLSDVAAQVSLNPMRNQIARNLDAMLEPPSAKVDEPLKRRRPGRSLFCLITPRVFKQNPRSRLYGWLMNDYRSNPASLGQDLAHRGGLDHLNLARRLGWLTWEDCAELRPTACPWLHRKGADRHSDA